MKIDYLANKPELLKPLAELYIKVWEPYYGLRGSGNAVADLQVAMQKDRLPICFVAEDMSGTVCLRSKSISHPDLGPWVTGLISDSEQVEKYLIQTVLNKAESLKLKVVYTSDNAAKRIYKDWEVIDTTNSLRGEISVMRFSL